MKRTFKLLIALFVVLMTVCIIAACDSDSCDHDFVEVRYEGNCVIGGIRYLECTKCGDTSSEKVAATGHDIEIIEAVAPTCTTKGSTEGQICKVCGEVVKEVEDVEPQHTLQTLAAKAATCTEDGLTEGKYCTACNQVIVPQMTVYASHNFKLIVAVPATCTEDGISEGEECVTCGLVLKESKVIPAGHTLEYVPAVAHTCTTDGHTAGYKCTSCSYVASGVEKIPAAHNNVVVSGKEGYPATCYSTGLSPEMICTECNKITSEQKEIPIRDHDPIVIEGYPASCTYTGLTDGSACSMCGDVIKEQEEIPMIDHTPATVKGYAATCTSVGLSDGEVCSGCGMIYKNQYTILSDGHTFGTDGKCVDCGIQITAELEYAPVDTSVYARSATRYMVTGLKDGADPRVIVIPETYEGCPVVGIMEGAFRNKSVKKVILPASIEMVGDNAFDGCANLDTVECADFTQTATWGTAWYGDAEFKITAILNGGKTPYEVYLDAMNSVAHNLTNFTMKSQSTAYFTVEGVQMPVLSMDTVQQQDGKNFLTWTYEEGSATIDTINGYIDNYMYSKFEGDSTIYRMSASYEFFLDQATISSASVEMGPEDFNNVEFYKAKDGKMHLSIDFCSDAIMELIEMLMESDDFFDGSIRLSSSVYNYVFDSTGMVEYYDYYVDAAGMFAIEGRTDIYNVGSTVLSTYLLDGYYTLSTPNCYGYHSNIVEVDAIEPTCFAEGRSAYSYCADCRTAITYMTPLDPQHNYVHGECTECGDFQNSMISSGLAYALNSDHTGYTVVGIGQCEDVIIYVPEYVYGRPVIGIANGAFEGTDVESVIKNGQTIWTKN